MRRIYYVLGGPDGHEPLPTDDVMQWGRMIENAARRQVALTKTDDYVISTVFLGIDHGSFLGRGCGAPPILFETMVFFRNGDRDTTGRYATWDEAFAGHAFTRAELESR